MPFNQQENLRDAILKKRARIAHIERILNRPLPTERRGQPVHVSEGSLLRLEEERQHLLIAVSELEREVERLDKAGQTTQQVAVTPFDERLFTLKLRESTQWMHSETEARRHKVMSGQGQALGTGLLAKLVNSDIGVFREYLPKVDNACRQTWLSDHDVVTPEFIRGVLVPHVSGMIAARKGAIGFGLELLAGRTGIASTDVTLALHHLTQEINKLTADLATQWEVEAIELGKQKARVLPATASMPPATAAVSPRESASEGERMDGKPASKADVWHDFHEKFMRLSDEERREGAAKRDRFVRASCTYKEHPEVFERAKPEQGPFCLLKTPECGLWIFSDGINENSRERFQTIATRAGIALGSPQDTDPVDFWLHRLFLDLRENNSRELLAASDEGGMILHVCEASATFCSRLERNALEASPSVLERDATQKPAKITKFQNRTKRTPPRQPLTLTERRAKAVSKLLRELQAVRPKMHNQGHYARVKRDHSNYLIFKLAQRDSDVKEWIENIQDRRGVVGLAQEIAARHFKVSLATVNTDWSHRRKPRRSPKTRR